ncbi:MAG: type II toxin-antitoxin system RelE/ParE family toxin [Bacteroidetes bacterium]|nr:type II toxin-antitoxin system RelE/ParE family toxin [Bacteroidota bacterium]
MIWTEAAIADLEVVYDFLAEKSPKAAQQTIESILKRTAQLELFPESGIVVQSLTTSDKVYRMLVESNYKIVYRFQSETMAVFIEIVFDARMDPEKLDLK